MDIGKVLGRAWEISWRWKVLWILGFLASLGGGYGYWGGNYTTDADGYRVDLGPWTGEKLTPGFWASMAGIVVALLCFGLLLAIAVWVVSIIARGGLIAGVRDIEDKGDTTFGQAWRAGAARFWTLLGIAVLAGLPFLILGLLMAVLAALGVLAAMGFSDAAETLAVPGIVSAIFCGVGFCCAMVILGIVLDQIRVYAERAAMLEGLGWIEAFGRGWQVLKDNLGTTVIVWLIFFAIGLMLAGLVFAGVVAVSLPIAGAAALFEPGTWLLAPVCCSGLVALIVFGLLGAIAETFTSATWTLTYRELTGHAGEDRLEATL